MKKKFQVAYLPIGVPTFHLESAQKESEDSIALLENLCEDVVYPKEMLLTMDLLKGFLEEISPDYIILQNITFANAAYASEVLHRFSCPVLLWTLREPVIDGGRLRLNSLTGAYSAANAFASFRQEPLGYIFGGPKEEEVKSTIKAGIAAAKAKFEMEHMTLTAVGHTPQGFGFGRALDTEMMTTFGVTLESIEARELIDVAKAYSDEEVGSYYQKACGTMKGLEATPEQNRKDFARLYKAYEEYVTSHGVKALASRCWPDFFTAFGTPVCAVLAMLNDMGVAASCEADTYGALSMFLGMEFSKQAVFFGDPVSMDEAEGTITYWHCGTAACSLARAEEGAQVGVHCNRKIGPTLEFGCKPSKEATIFRIGKDAKGEFRFFLATGEILDKPKQFNGTSVVVKTTGSAKETIYESVKDGWEPHFVVIYQNVKEEIKMLADMLQIKVLDYDK